MAYDWKTIANSATTIPGTAVTFSSFSQPSINLNCRLVFRGRSTGPNTPVRGVYAANGCDTPRIRKVVQTGEVVPAPNNLAAPFNEFPSIPRIDVRKNIYATRGQSQPVWEYVLNGTDTRVGTAGIYVAQDGNPPVTGLSQLGAVPGFEYFAVPGFPGVKFDQFPGSPAPFGAKFVAFKGNFTDGTTSRTGVYYRNVLDGPRTVRKIADSTTTIPGTATLFGSTAPPSAADDSVVFLGVDVEDAPTVGGLYLSRTGNPTVLQALMKIGDPVPGVTPAATFTRFGEALTYDGKYMGFWGAWGTETRTVKLYCPTDGNSAVLQECAVQCPTTDAGGNYCEREVPVNQGVFSRDDKGRFRLIARAGTGLPFKDFLFWVFSGRPPGTGGGDADDDFEGPRWRSSNFIAISDNENKPATAFKALTIIDKVGIFQKRQPSDAVDPVILVGDPAATIDASAPAGSLVSAVGMEREGYRGCRLSVTASFLNSTTSESWAGVYVERNACKP